MTDRFADRLAPETYRSDESWSIAIVGAGRLVDWTAAMPDENDAIPERIGQRLLALAHAYELHQLSTLEPYTQNRLNSQQAANLVEELEFLFERVNDPALRQCAEPLYRLASRCSRDTRVELLVEGP